MSSPPDEDHELTRDELISCMASNIATANNPFGAAFIMVAALKVSHPDAEVMERSATALVEDVIKQASPEIKDVAQAVFYGALKAILMIAENSRESTLKRKADIATARAEFFMRLATYIESNTRMLPHTKAELEELWGKDPLWSEIKTLLDKIPIGDGSEPDAVFVCQETGGYEDNVPASCAECGRPIVHRPHIPATGKKVCKHCAQNLGVIGKLAG